MKDFKNKIQSITAEPSGTWKEDATYKRENKWLLYSSEIALRILALIEDNPELNQSKLAKALDVSPQQISKIIKGKENLTLETIYKLSQALEFELIAFPEYGYNKPLGEANPIQEECKVVQMQQYPDQFTKYELGNKSYSL